MALHQFDYIFAISMMFAFLDAWNIGANDVANSFATSISSRALTYPQAMFLAAICEFLGAVLAGARVSDTIRNKIIDVSAFENAPAGLMLAMACALVGSSTWLTFATRLGAPVSTTHSIVGGIIGAGIAANGAQKIHWGWNGFAKIVASWFVAPAIAGAFAAGVFLITKYGILERRNSLRIAMLTIPAYCAFTAGVLIMVIVWKGAPNLKLDNLSSAQVLGAIFGGAGVAAALYGFFWYPFLYRKLVLEDWTLKPWDILYGPLLFRRGPVPPAPEGSNHQIVIDYYAGRRTREEYENVVDTGVSGVNGEYVDNSHANPEDIEKMAAMSSAVGVNSKSDSLSQVETDNANNEPVKLDKLNRKTLPFLLKPKNWHRLI